MKRILVNAAQEEELRVALVDGQRLYDLDIEIPSQIRKKANIYKGIVTRVEPSLEAAFVDFGTARHGFLPWKEISDQYRVGTDTDGGKNKNPIREGAEVVVQVEKEERGNKGAALSTLVSLAGRYLVLMPNNPKLGGISRRIEGEERAQIKESLRALDIPDNMGLIVRTAGVGKQSAELQLDLDYLLNLWRAIQEAAGRKAAPFLIHEESNVVIRTLRDHLRKDIGEVLFDTRESWEEAINFMRQVMPQYESRVRLYDEKLPLFNRFQIENQIEGAFGRSVRLPSGGTLSIDPTEALVSIDVNSARATRGADIHETALTTNLEAADEVARQLRLRDIGGLIVIDFIDMTSTQHQRLVENRMREALETDRARVQCSRISRFGLLEMSRQRLRASLEETSSIVCPRCNGQGRVRDVKSLALSILRIIREEAGKEKNREVRVEAPIDVATYLLNEKREEIAAIEEESGSSLLIAPDAVLVTPHYRIDGLNRKGEEYEVEHTEIPEAPPAEEAASGVPAVSRVAVEDARPSPTTKGVVAKLAGVLRGFIGGATSTEGEARQRAPAKKAAKTQAASGGGKPAQARKPESRDPSGNRAKHERRGRGGRRQEQSDRRNAKKDLNENAKQGSEEVSENKAAERSPAKRRRQPAKNRRREVSTDHQAEPVAADGKTDDAETMSSATEEQQSSQGRAKRRPAAKRPRNSTQRSRGPRPTDAEQATVGDSPSDVDDAAVVVKIETETAETIPAPGKRSKAKEQPPKAENVEQPTAEDAVADETTTMDDTAADQPAEAASNPAAATAPAAEDVSKAKDGARGGRVKRSRKRSVGGKSPAAEAADSGTEAGTADSKKPKKPRQSKKKKPDVVEKETLEEAAKEKPGVTVAPGDGKTSLSDIKARHSLRRVAAAGAGDDNTGGDESDASENQVAAEQPKAEHATAAQPADGAVKDEPDAAEEAPRPAAATTPRRGRRAPNDPRELRRRAESQAV